MQRLTPSLGLVGVIVVIATEVVVASHGFQPAVVYNDAVVVSMLFDLAFSNWKFASAVMKKPKINTIDIFS